MIIVKILIVNVKNKILSLQSDFKWKEQDITTQWKKYSKVVKTLEVHFSNKQLTL